MNKEDNILNLNKNRFVKSLSKSKGQKSARQRKKWFEQPKETSAEQDEA